MIIQLADFCREAVVLALAELTDNYVFSMQISGNDLILNFEGASEPEDDLVLQLLQKHALIQDIETKTRYATNKISLNVFTTPDPTSPTTNFQNHLIPKFRFKQIGNAYLITNDFGNYTYVDSDLFNRLKDDKLLPKDKPLLRKGLFYIDELNYKEALSDLKLFATKFYGAPNTFILKFTNACNYNCVYCQASSSNKNKDAMCSVETAHNCVDLMLQSPAKHLTLEIQGGEPLLNWSVVEDAVLYCESKKKDKQVHYRMMSNLSLLNDEHINFCRKYDISLGTSIDGPKAVNDVNRISCNGISAFDQTAVNMQKLRELNRGRCGFITTVTKHSTEHTNEVVNFSIDVQNNYNARPLFKLGAAIGNWDEIGYDPETFISFYKEAVMLCINRYLDGNTMCKERNITSRARKIIRHINGDIENGSPCGAIQCMVSIDWNGDILACEGSKMLLPPYRDKFVLGNVNDPNITFDKLFFSTHTQQILSLMFSENDIKCSNCVYLPFCGNCSVERSSTNVYTTFNCAINEASFDFIFELLRNDTYRDVLTNWVDSFGC